MRLEINRKWWDKYIEEHTQICAQPNDKELAKKCYLIDFDDELFRIENYDNDLTFVVSNYDEDKTEQSIYASITVKVDTNEAGILAQLLTKMFNRLKNALDSLN